MEDLREVVLLCASRNATMYPSDVACFSRHLKVSTERSPIINDAAPGSFLDLATRSPENLLVPLVVGPPVLDESSTLP